MALPRNGQHNEAFVQFGCIQNQLLWLNHELPIHPRSSSKIPVNFHKTIITLIILNLEQHVLTSYKKYMVSYVDDLLYNW